MLKNILNVLAIILILLLSTPIIITGNEKVSEYHNNVDSAMNTVYLSLEQPTKDYMHINNYHIEFLKENQKCSDVATPGEKIDDRTAAYINYKTKIIRIGYIADKDWLTCNLYHEIGHMEDERLGFISETTNFSKIYRLRYDFFKRFEWANNEYYTENRRECFAQMYSTYMQYGEWLEFNFPSIYNYFKGLTL